MDEKATLKYLYGLGNEVLTMKLGLESMTLLLESGACHVHMRVCQCIVTRHC